MEITVNVDNVDLNTVIGETVVYDGDGEPHNEGGRTIADVVVDAVTNRLCQAVTGSHGREVYRRIAEVRDDEIRSMVRPIIEAALVDEIALTNTYGERTGKVTTLREVIVAETHKVLTKRDGYSGGPTVVEKLIRDEVSRTPEDDETNYSDRATLDGAVWVVLGSAWAKV